jgi:hypothetical protein
VVELPVPAPREAVGDPPARGHLDGSGARVGGEVMTTPEPGDVTDIADEDVDVRTYG